MVRDTRFNIHVYNISSRGFSNLKATVTPEGSIYVVNRMRPSKSKPGFLLNESIIEAILILNKNNNKKWNDLIDFLEL